MAETLLFTIPAPTAAEDPAYTLYWHQSVDGSSWGAAIDTILVSALPTDPVTGKLVWASLTADPLKYHTIRTASQSGVINTQSQTIPPRHDYPMTELFVDVRDLLLDPKADIVFTITPKTNTVNGIVIDPGPITRQTDPEGMLSVFVPQGCVYEVTSTAMGGKTLKVVTVGKTFVNLGKLVTA